MQGLLVTIAIGVHNIPEGMAVAGVMMSRGSTPSKALYWTLICSFPQARSNCIAHRADTSKI